MASLNQCNFIANAADAPEVRTFNDGNKIATFRIAVTERFTDRAGEQKENTEWITCVCNNGKLADVAERFIVKGSSLFVSGKYHTRQWQDQQGQKHYATEIVVLNFQLLGPKPQAQQSAPAPQIPQTPPPPAYPQPSAPPQYQQPPMSPQTPVPPAQPQYQSAPQYPPMGAPEYTQPQGGDLPF